MKYCLIRSPYIDLTVIKRVLMSELSGVNNTFYTHNPLKRYKGQCFYATIIKNAYSPLLYHLNDKGYKPIDLLSSYGIYNILKGYVKKRVNRKIKKQDYDNLGILSGFEKNKAYLLNISHSEFFNQKKIINMFECTDWYKRILERDNLLNSLASQWFINEEFGI